MTAKLLYPAFDPKTETWFVGTPRAEAPTLRALKGILGSGYRLVGYHPNGFTVPPWPAKPLKKPTIIAEKANPLPRIRSTTLPTPGLAGGRRRLYDHDTVMNLWAAGYNGPQIATALGYRTSAISDIVSKFRERNDPRAVKRKYKPGEPRPASLTLKDTTETTGKGEDSENGMNLKPIERREGNLDIPLLPESGIPFPTLEKAE